MKVIAVNGSPRKKWNTGTLLKNALEGAESKGAETELIHIYDLNYKGCISCFQCKLKNGKNYGRCSMSDDLTPVLERIRQADALIMGSPIYVGAVTGEMRSFIERLVFPNFVYNEGAPALFFRSRIFPKKSSIFPKRIKTAFIYTMGMDNARMKELGWDKHLKSINELVLERILGQSESLFVTDTYQFDDYSKYVSGAFDIEKKLKIRKELFPEDCRKAYELGARFASCVTDK